MPYKHHGVKYAVLYVSVGIFLWRVYPNERIDNFFVYEQFIITMIWLGFNELLLFFLGMYNGHTYEILLLALQISHLLQIMFEIFLPQYVIEKYGYPDPPKEIESYSDTTISSDRQNQGTNKAMESKTTADSLEYTMRSQLGIDEIMSDKNFRDLFSKYLGREFQTEIFLFFDVLQYYKEAVAENNSKTFAIEDAKLIIEEFIADDAVNKLPLSDTIRQRILDDFGKLGDVENPLDVTNIFQPAINYLNIELSFHIYKFNMNV